MSYTLPPPAKPATPGLSFDNKPYNVSSINPLERFQNNNFAGLNALVQLSLGDGSQYPLQSILIDSRSNKPELLDSIPSGLQPDLVTTIMPEYILDVIEGRMHAQHAFGKRAQPPCLGAFPACFSPSGCPAPVVAVDQLDIEALPRPTEDIEQIKGDLTKWGYAICANALSLEQVRILRTAVEEQAEAERLAGVGHMDSAHKNADDQPNQRVWNLPNKGDEFLDLLNHPLVDAIMPWFLGGNFNIFTMSANIAKPGKSGIYMHRDQMGLTPETTEHAYVLGAMWYLTDVTEEKGATRVYPGSHIGNVAPLSTMNSVGGSIAAAAPAGSCLLLDSRTWHSTGVNTTTEDTRPIILQSFCRFFVRQIENYHAILSEEVKAKLSDRQRALLGLPPISKPGGNTAQGFAVYNWPGTEAGKMRAPVTGAVVHPKDA
ncbi:hypothetical protein DL766_004716 [Monosporascus sp. MC13-8B]|uniref:Phytanoyl-CoA dioxygenase n=1 Tax=Monosporascus cannonballus TaxID=155416 RepID=A0ABY0H169_9PEZI|nr:hypothetical protein DL762_007109 [Monosporascus cannonballus]RYP01314.1 hypothetical protein DL763_000286 [Monosporascus cannonballus]RYP30768.1 hypothetical protein DL766_004716 [Monosporascus sp. MC13-8B]